MVIRVGTSGWSYDHWHPELHPPGLPVRARLTRYAAAFATAELNSRARSPAARLVRAPVPRATSVQPGPLTAVGEPNDRAAALSRAGTSPSRHGKTRRSMTDPAAWWDLASSASAGRIRRLRDLAGEPFAIGRRQVAVTECNQQTVTNPLQYAHIADSGRQVSKCAESLIDGQIKLICALRSGWR